MQHLIIEAQILTPIIMAGANTFQPEIREQSIKGLLRWWYRFYKSSFVNSLDELKKAEAEIWGSTEKTSQVKLQILSRPNRTGDAYLCMNDQRTNPPASKPYDKIKRSSYYPYLSFQSRLIFSLLCSPEKQKEAIFSLWLLNMLGGIGARWRRGFGSIKSKINNQATYENFSFEYMSFEKAPEVLKILYENKSWGNYVCSFPTLKNTKIYCLKPSNKKWITWQDAMNELRDKFYRDFKKDIGVSSLGSANPREASPIVIQIKQTQNKEFFGVISVFRDNFKDGRAPITNLFDKLENFLKKQKSFHYREVSHV